MNRILLILAYIAYIICRAIVAIGIVVVLPIVLMIAILFYFIDRIEFWIHLLNKRDRKRWCYWQWGGGWTCFIRLDGKCPYTSLDDSLGLAKYERCSSWKAVEK